MRVAVHERIDDLSTSAWNGLLAEGYPFLRHEFLAALERTGCVGGSTGWVPCHVTAHEGHRLVGAMPLYAKTHSMGEFVFDFAWADAYERHGLSYYPKLVCAAPFTPATGPRLLTRDRSGEVADALLAGARDLAGQLGASSLHCLFPDAATAEELAARGLLLRKGCQFHWRNDDYRDFQDFLDALTSRRRKKIRRERRRVAEQGIGMEARHGDELGAKEWDRVHELYASTYHLRGQLPYLDRAFFDEIATTMGGQIVLFLARHGGRIVAAAITLRGGDTLYGRHWGADDDYHSLHFEACYYQGLEYCVKHGLARFDPGTQGEHKVSRGFLPVPTWSAHWLEHAGFRDAVADFLRRETPMIDRYIEAMAAYSPYRAAEAGDAS